MVAGQAQAGRLEAKGVFPLLRKNELSGRYYIVTRYRINGDNNVESRTKFECTGQFELLAEQWAAEHGWKKPRDGKS